MRRTCGRNGTRPRRTSVRAPPEDPAGRPLERWRELERAHRFARPTARWWGAGRPGSRLLAMRPGAAAPLPSAGRGSLSGRPAGSSCTAASVPDAESRPGAEAALRRSVQPSPTCVTSPTLPVARADGAARPPCPSRRRPTLFEPRSTVPGGASSLSPASTPSTCCSTSAAVPHRRWRHLASTVPNPARRCAGSSLLREFYDGRARTGEIAFAARVGLRAALDRIGGFTDPRPGRVGTGTGTSAGARTWPEAGSTASTSASRLRRPLGAWIERAPGSSPTSRHPRSGLRRREHAHYPSTRAPRTRLAAAARSSIRVLPYARGTYSTARVRAEGHYGDAGSSRSTSTS